MGLKRGFDATVTVGTGSDAKTVKTRGDITYTESYTEIEVKNAASNDVRYIPGMRTAEFSMAIQAGTDPEDSADYDAYAALLAYYNAGTTFPITFTSPGGFTKTENFVITNWTDNDPVDGLNDATLTLRISGGTAGESFFTTSSSSGSSGNGTT